MRPVERAAGEVLEDLADRGAEDDLVVAGSLTWPEIEISFVPADFSVPILANSAPPLLRMNGTLISVSTLLTTVGPRYRPGTAGNGGFRRGLPRLPSSESSSAVSSPQM